MCKTINNVIYECFNTQCLTRKFVEKKCNIWSGNEGTKVNMPDDRLDVYIDDESDCSIYVAINRYVHVKCNCCVNPVVKKYNQILMRLRFDEEDNMYYASCLVSHIRNTVFTFDFGLMKELNNYIKYNRDNLQYCMVLAMVRIIVVEMRCRYEDIGFDISEMILC